jgi:hypothetical protein
MYLRAITHNLESIRDIRTPGGLPEWVVTPWCYTDGQALDTLIVAGMEVAHDCTNIDTDWCTYVRAR